MNFQCAEFGALVSGVSFSAGCLFMYLALSRVRKVLLIPSIPPITAEDVRNYVEQDRYIKELNRVTREYLNKIEVH